MSIYNPHEAMPKVRQRRDERLGLARAFTFRNDPARIVHFTES
jgi:hypothetical protein